MTGIQTQRVLLPRFKRNASHLPRLTSLPLDLTCPPLLLLPSQPPLLVSLLLAVVPVIHDHRKAVPLGVPEELLCWLIGRLIDLREDTPLS